MELDGWRSDLTLKALGHTRSGEPAIPDGIVPVAVMATFDLGAHAAKRSYVYGPDAPAVAGRYAGYAFWAPVAFDCLIVVASATTALAAFPVIEPFADPLFWAIFGAAPPVYLNDPQLPPRNPVVNSRVGSHLGGGVPAGALRIGAGDIALGSPLTLTVTPGRVLYLVTTVIGGAFRAGVQIREHVGPEPVVTR